MVRIPGFHNLGLGSIPEIYNPASLTAWPKGGKKKMRIKISPEMTLFTYWQQSRELITAVLARVWGRRLS